jgi:hypothetical protein
MGNKSSEGVEHLGTTQKSQNLILEEIQSRLKSENACYHSVQNLLYSSFLSKNIKNKIYRTVPLPVLCVGVKLDLSH